MELKKKLGKQIRYLRKKRGITQALLAEKTGLSDNFIGLLERGLTSPSLETLDKISKALKVSMKELFDFEPSKEPNREKILNEIEMILKNNSDENVNWLHRIIKLLSEKV